MNYLNELLKRKEALIFTAVFFIIFVIKIVKSTPTNMSDDIAQVKRQNIAVDVKTIGELEAAKSTTISSLIKGENGKIIYIIPDGTNTTPGEILVKMDPTPFEEKLETLKGKLKEQEGHIAILKKALDFEISQAERDEKLAEFELEAAELEYNKIIHGDGPLELAKLKGAMQKALAKFEELSGYSEDLIELETQGFLNPAEIKTALKKMQEEKEAYESTKLQYESYLNHVLPMQIKKAEAAVKQAKMKREEAKKVRGHSIGKAQVELSQAKQLLEGIQYQIAESLKELALTEIQAPSPGMVVHREDFRTGTRRKPRLGDIILRNQAIIDLPDLNVMIVKSKVREIDLCKVEINKKATVEIDAYPDLNFTGTISSIGVLALPEPGKPTEEKYFDVRILLDKSDPRVRPGMTARIVIHTDDLENVVAIPLQALFCENKKNYCFVKTKRGFEKREVLIGLSNDEWVVIKEGLKEGEKISLSKS